MKSHLERRRIKVIIKKRTFFRRAFYSSAIDSGQPNPTGTIRKIVIKSIYFECKSSSLPQPYHLLVVIIHETRINWRSSGKSNWNKDEKCCDFYILHSQHPRSQQQHHSTMCCIVRRISFWNNRIMWATTQVSAPLIFLILVYSLLLLLPIATLKWKTTSTVSRVWGWACLCNK